MANLTDNDIWGTGQALSQAVKDGDDDKVKEYSTTLGINLLVDINRIANALEQLARIGMDGHDNSRG